MRSQADHTYGYAEALADGVVRPVVFLAYSGEARWRDSAGEEHAARLGEPLNAEQTARAWRTVLNPKGEWMPAVIAGRRHPADAEAQRHVPDAGGMIIASDQTAARAYAALLTKFTGEAPTVVLSDDPGSSDRISEFAAGTGRWLVAVRMVSEGVDVPRLAVGVYATSASTPLFFAQAIGRYVRSRQPGETASIFLPSVPTCCCWPARWRPSATTCSASRTASTLERRARRRTGRAEARPSPTRGQRLRVARRRRRTRSGHLRRLVVRHGDTGGQRRGSRLPRHPRPARRRRRCETCCGAGRKSSSPKRHSQRRSVPPVVDARPAARAAQRAQHAGVGRPPPHRQAARLDPQRAAPDLRRPADRGRDDRSAQGPHRSGPRPHGVTSANSARWASELSRCATGNGGTRFGRPAAQVVAPLTSHR